MGIACGGGDENVTVEEPEAPVLSLSPQSIKIFRFSWEDVSGETEYRLLENADGSSGFTQVPRIAADTTNHELEVFLPRRINASYILEVCDSGGRCPPNTVFVSGTLAEAAGYVKASYTRPQERFGISVSLSGDGETLAVGASLEDSNATGIGGDHGNNDAAGSGAVYFC